MVSQAVKGREGFCVLLSAALPLALVILASSIGSGESQFCSFFGNRSPGPQPGLQNCTWYRESSCCSNDEITSLFTNINPPDQANSRCRNFINYMMCYVCDPGQSNFYRSRQLTVCRDFCDDYLSACSDAVLKGFRLGSRFGTNGTSFCNSLRFDVGTQSETCFTLAENRRTLSSASSVRPSYTLLLVTAVLLGGLRGKSLLVALAILSLLLPLGTRGALVTDSNIQDMATAVENSLVNIGNDGIQRDMIQDLYESASSSREALNASTILATIRSQLQELVGELSDSVDELVRAIAYARADYIIQGSPRANLSALPPSIFTDADDPTAFSNLDSSYNRSAYCVCMCMHVYTFHEWPCLLHVDSFAWRTLYCFTLTGSWKGAVVFNMTICESFTSTVIIQMSTRPLP